MTSVAPPPYAHQLIALERMRPHTGFALWCQQRTGKTRMVLMRAEELYAEQKIDAVLVVAPAGVHRNWVTDEIPRWLTTSYRAVSWSSGKAKRKRFVEALSFLVNYAGLAILAVNVDALITENLLTYLRYFVKRRRVLFVHDECSDAKNPSAKRSRKAYAIAANCPYRLIMDGTPDSESPLELFGQLRLLFKEPLGFKTQQAFDHRYAEWETGIAWNRTCWRCRGRRHPGQAPCPSCANLPPGPCPSCGGSKTVCEVCFGDGRGRYPTIAEDDSGRKKFQNLEELAERIAPFSYRFTRDQFHDAPPKLRAKRAFELTAQQREIYDDLRLRFRHELANPQQPITAAHVLTRFLRLQQVTCGFVQPDRVASPCPVCAPLDRPEELCPICQGVGLVDGDYTPRPIDNPRLEALTAELERTSGQLIIWSRFRYDLRVINDRLTDLGVTHVSYAGGMTDKAKDHAKTEFQSKRVRVFNGNPSAAGRGLLLPADDVFYYSNSHSRRQREQSEDRAITLQDQRSVAYLDLVAEDTVDQLLLDCHAEKREVSDVLMRELNRWL